MGQVSFYESIPGFNRLVACDQPYDLNSTTVAAPK